MTQTPRKAVAVVAMGLAVPGADSPEELWDLILNNRTCFREATAEDFGALPSEFYQDSELPAPDKAYSLTGAWRGDRPDVPEGLDLPSSFKALECDASLLYWLSAGQKAQAGGVLSGHNPQEVGVIAGHVILPTSAQSEAAVSLYGQEATLNWEFNPFPPPPKTNPFRAVGYSARLLARALGLSGPAFTVDAACASSLYAMKLAADHLTSGQLTAVITGGLAKADPLFTQLGFSQLRALSKSGLSRPFDHRADGLVVGSGACALILKTVERARADGDDILAVLLSVGLGNDRTGNLLAPDPQGQARVMKEAFLAAGRSPRALGLVEAHGTSTLVGDKAEITALKILLEKEAPVIPPVVGSVKSNVGHLLSAAGAVAAAKAILALRHKILPPTAGFEKSAVDLGSKPALRILTKGEPWPEPKNRARLAAANAFGFGGVNAQALFEEYSPALWQKPKSIKKSPPRPLSASLIAARTVLAPWPTYDTLARFWLTPEEPPMAQTRRMGSLKTTGFFFEDLTLDTSVFKLPPKELADCLPQQTLALIAGSSAVRAAGLEPGVRPADLDPDRLGIFMGVEIDPRAADLALRWTAPLTAAEAFIKRGLIAEKDKDGFVESLRAGGPPALTHTKVLGALGSFVASRLARFLGSGGPALTLSEERDSGFRALTEAVTRLNDGSLDIALVGVVDTFGDPKTGYLAPRTVWVEGAAVVILASKKAAELLSPLAELTLNASETRIGPLSGLFALNRNAFYLRHHLKPLGRGRGMVYWLKNPGDRRILSGSGYELAEAPGHKPSTLTVPPDPIRPDVWFFFKATDNKPPAESLNHLSRLLEVNAHKSLENLTREFWAREKARPGRPALAVLARDSRELGLLIKKALAGEEDRDLKPRILKAPAEPLKGDLAFVFPGSGNHYKGLGRGLGLAFPAVMNQLESEVSEPVAQFQSELFWEPNYKKPSVRQALLAQVNFGLLGARVLKSLEIEPQAALGYSLGETTALVALGLWPDREDLWQSLLSSTLFENDLAGEFKAAREHFSWPAKKSFKWLCGLIPRAEKNVAQALENLTPALRFRAFILIVNTDEEVTVGGEEQAVLALVQALEAPFFPVEDVPSVHAPVINSVKDEYYKFHIRPVKPQPGLKIYSSAWAKSYDLEPRQAAESLTAQALSGHRFPDLINKAYSDGIRFFVEIGPGSSASRLIKTILAQRPHLALSLAGTAVDEGWAGLSQLLAELWLAGQTADPFKGLPQPTPEADPRFLVPVNLDPPDINWPTPPCSNNHLAKSPKAKATDPNVDFMHWLTDQTAKPEPGPGPGQTAESLKVTRKRRPKDDLKITADILPGPRPQDTPPDNTAGPQNVRLTREDCLEFAVGSIAKVLGPEFAEADTFPTRVLLPDEPLMLVDRVLTIEGSPKSLGPGRIVTEHDLNPGDWYLEDDYITPGMAIESGQADLMLSAYLGADFSTRGLAQYRLLDAEVVFHRELPKTGQVASYDIRILRFFHHGETLMFRFEIDGTVGGEKLLTMRQGCAGFFTPKALKAGRGLASSQPEAVKSVGQSADLMFAPKEFPTLSASDINALRSGRMAHLGPGFENMEKQLENPLVLPAGSLNLFDSVPKIDRQGGIYGRGFIRSEARIEPQAWFLVSHFKGDEVMPGTLMYDACLQTLRFYLLSLGWVGQKGQVFWQPPLGQIQSLKCRGQVTPLTSRVAYDVHIRELKTVAGPQGINEPLALAEAVMWADGRPIVEVKNLGLRLAGQDAEYLKRLWSSSGAAKKIGPGPPLSQPDQEASKKPKTARAPKEKPGQALSDPKSALGQKSDPPRSGPRRAGLLPHRPGKNYFDKNSLAALDQGLIADVFGPRFSRFNDGSFVARLPSAPYDFVDEAFVVTGQAGRISPGTSVEAAWSPDTDNPARHWLLGQAGGLHPVLPYAALNEIALQACGFISSYMGSALLFDEPMYFRNLGGRATVFQTVRPNDPAPVITKATLTKSSVLGQMAIQYYDFVTSQDDQEIYRGQTHFGFFNHADLARQGGLKVEPQTAQALTRPEKIQNRPYPRGQAWPLGRWLMLDEVAQGSDELKLWAQSRVRPEAWFFQAHFPGDPVWPGSLGLEGFFQAAKYLAVRSFYKNPPESFPGSFSAPLTGQSHSWLYRGQIPPSSREMSLGLLVSNLDTQNKFLNFSGLLSVDGLVVYQVDNFTVGLLDF
ncbi:MAG: hypothetical protein LBP22_09960 [Deltaproteobacteria bacterium]|jgi:acyl transferase domain-containing protein/3-hydroxymyristoyl/3-hydroxydecanoyl-(acyl carrier protein) dehydratase|nr:hypothetical protein [Deltaproteobacteria bacterium]